MSNGLNGYAQRFECRPEDDLLGEVVDRVVDASSVSNRSVDDLKVISIASVFSGSNEIFYGAGEPNQFLVVPNGRGGYQKFAVKSLKRGPSEIQDNVRLVQSSVFVRFTNLPPHAADRLREGMQKYEGAKFITCVNGNMHVFDYAGFTLGDGTPLTECVWPYATLRAILRHGLLFEGQKVEFDVVRTTKSDLGQHSKDIVEAVVFTIPRHIKRNYNKLAKTNKAVGIFKTGVDKLGGFVAAPFRGKKCPSKRIKAPIAPALPDNMQYRQNLYVRVSKAGLLACALRQTWGAHSLFELQQDRVNIDDYLPETLEPFPQQNPDAFTRLKKRVLMSPGTVNFIRGILVPGYQELRPKSEVDVYDMLRTDSDESPNKYNLVITTDSIVIARTNAGWKAVDWLLSKHIVLGGWGSDKRYAGRVWKDKDGVIHVDKDSGTLRPNDAKNAQAVSYLQAVFPNLKIVKD